MNVFLQFLFDVEKLNTHVRPTWITIYDPSYIDQKIIGGLHNNFSLFADLISTISEKATGHRS